MISIICIRILVPSRPIGVAIVIVVCFAIILFGYVFVQALFGAISLASINDKAFNHGLATFFTDAKTIQFLTRTFPEVGITSMLHKSYAKLCPQRRLRLAFLDEKVKNRLIAVFHFCIHVI